MGAADLEARRAVRQRRGGSHGGRRAHACASPCSARTRPSGIFCQLFKSPFDLKLLPRRRPCSSLPQTLAPLVRFAPPSPPAAHLPHPAQPNAPCTRRGRAAGCPRRRPHTARHKWLHLDTHNTPHTRQPIPHHPTRECKHLRVAREQRVSQQVDSQAQAAAGKLPLLLCRPAAQAGRRTGGGRERETNAVRAGRV